MEAASVSVAEADRIERGLDAALYALREAGERGLIFLERRVGPPTTAMLPRGRDFCEALDRLISFGLVEIITPDKTVGPAGVTIFERARLTESGRARAVGVGAADTEGAK
jgi:hypothetical protein